jgi:hypothetical protein
VAGEPLEPRVAVLNGHRVGELRCETVLHGGRDGAVLQDPLDEHRCDRPSAPTDHAATVEEIDARTGRTLVATAPQHRDDDLAATVTGHGVVGDLDRPPRDDPVERRRRTRGRRSERRNGIRLERSEERGRRVECGFELNIERWTGTRGHLDPPVLDHCHVTDASSSSDSPSRERDVVGMRRPPTALGTRSLSPCDGAGSTFVRVAPLPGTSTGWRPAVSQSSPRTTLAEGAITQTDHLVIELVAPKDSRK